MADSEKLKWLIKAVAHVGVDFGYGKFELNEQHIQTARELDEKLSNATTLLSIRETGK